MFNRIALIVLFLLSLYPVSFIQAQETSCPRPDTWAGTYIVQAGDNLFRIAQNNNVDLEALAEANCISDIQSISVGQVLYLPSGSSSIRGFVALTLYSLGDGNVMTCQADAIQIATTEVATGDVEQDLRTTLNLFFSDQYRTNPGSGLINTWASFNINVDSVRIENAIATIALTGDYIGIGACADAAYDQQLRHNILMYPEIDGAIVTMNGQNLRAILDASGRSNQDSQYVRPTNPDLCPIPLGWQSYQIPTQTNLFRIARDVGTHYSVLADRSCLPDASRIEAGNTIYLPQLPEVSTSSVPTSLPEATLIATPTISIETNTSIIKSFVISPDPVQRSGIVTFSWEVENATTISITRLSETGGIFLESITDNLPTVGSIGYQLPDTYVTQASFILLVQDAQGNQSDITATANITCLYNPVWLTDSCPYRQLSAQVVSQQFENGQMVWRSDTQQIYVLLDTGTFATHIDEWQAGIPIEIDEESPSGQMIPSNGFGYLWSRNENVRQQLGWAIGVEQSLNGTIETNLSSWPLTEQSFIPLPAGDLLILPTSIGTWTIRE